MPGGFIERMERIADHLGDGWVVGDLTADPDGISAAARYDHEGGRRVRWTVTPGGQCVSLQDGDGTERTWLDSPAVDVRVAADAIQDCVWFVERGQAASGLMTLPSGHAPPTDPTDASAVDDPRRRSTPTASRRRHRNRASGGSRDDSHRGASYRNNPETTPPNLSCVGPVTVSSAGAGCPTHRVPPPPHSSTVDPRPPLQSGVGRKSISHHTCRTNNSATGRR